MPRTPTRHVILIWAAALGSTCATAASLDEAAREAIPNFDGRAICMIECIGRRQDDTTLVWPRQAFAIGDGTLLLTAAHCIDDFGGPDEHPISRNLFLVSPYYGDMFDFEVVAVDKEADLAILRAPWPAHPALAIAGERDLAKAKQVIIASRPLNAHSKRPHQFDRSLIGERLRIRTTRGPSPSSAIVLTRTKLVRKGWSGSPVLLPGTGKVAGVLCKLINRKILWFRYQDPAGCSIRSAHKLLERHGLTEPAAGTPSGLPPIEGADRAFSTIMDHFQALLGRRDVTLIYDLGKTLVELRPESVYGRVCLAMAAELRASASNGDGDRFTEIAEHAYAEAIRLRPDSARVHTAYGDFLLRQKRSDEALAQTEAAFRLDPNDSLAGVNLLRMLSVRDPERASRLGRQITQRDSENAYYWFYYRDALLRLGRTTEALEAAEKAVELRPDGLFYGGLADVLIRLDRHDQAEECYVRMTRDCSCQRCWYQYARFLRKHRPDRLSEARQALEEAQAKAKSNRVSQQNMTELAIDLSLEELRQLQNDDSPEGETLARQLGEQYAQNAHYWWALADVMRSQARYDEAVEAAQRAVRMGSESMRPRLADCLAKAGRLDQAQRTYDRMLQDHPERPKYWFWYARFLVEHFPQKTQQIGEAIEKAESAGGAGWAVDGEDLRRLRDRADDTRSDSSTTE